MWPNLQETADLVTFTEKILDGKLNLYSDPNELRLGFLFTGPSQHFGIYPVTLVLHFLLLMDKKVT